MTDRDERKRASTDQTTHIAEYEMGLVGAIFGSAMRADVGFPS
jgi:hypothetical protein